MFGKFIISRQSGKEIKDLGLSVRAYNALAEKNINTIGELLDYGIENTAIFKNIGDKSLIEIREAVERHVPNETTKR